MRDGAAKQKALNTVASAIERPKLVIYHAPDLHERSSHWPHVRGVWIHIHNTCAVCGCKDDLDVHHIKPFHLFPALELEPTNFITLCRAHHLLFGHLMSWPSYNPHVVEDVAAWVEKISARPKAA